MYLEYPSRWRFDIEDFAIPIAAIKELSRIIEIIAEHSDIQKDIYEVVKEKFGATNVSSTVYYARYDMEEALKGKLGNAAEFVQLLWSVICDIEKRGIEVPEPNQINKILKRHNIPLTIDPPNLLRSESHDSSSHPMKYELGAKIGEGGYGQVFKAVRKNDLSDFHVAVKVLNPSAFITDKAKARDRFKREVKTLQALQHRAIVPYLDAGQDLEGRPFLVMPYIDGKPFRDLYSSNNARLAVDMMIEVLNGLGYAHKNDVLHRDLKPSNILIRDSDGQPIILDFGCAYLFEEVAQESITASLVGSLGYIPSEVITNPKVRSKKHDLYSCGIILYEIIRGRRPDPREYIPLGNTDSHLRVVDVVIQRAIAPPQDRYETAEDFMGELEQLRPKLPVSS